MTTVLGYVRVSTAEQASGYGLAAQESAIRDEVSRRGWRLLDVVRDEGATGKHLGREGLQSALERIARREADGLVVAKLDRLSRSVIDFGLLLEWFEDAGAQLIALDLGIDTSTAGGRLVANVFASVAEWERDTISERTRAGLRAAKAEGRPVSRPGVPEAVADRIRALRANGLSYGAIAQALNEDGIPTPRGGKKWRPSSIQTTLGHVRQPPRRRFAELPRPRAGARVRGG